MKCSGTLHVFSNVQCPLSIFPASGISGSCGDLVSEKLSCRFGVYSCCCRLVEYSHRYTSTVGNEQRIVGAKGGELKRRVAEMRREKAETGIDGGFEEEQRCGKMWSGCDPGLC